jgi:hypothetical protein
MIQRDHHLCPEDEDVLRRMHDEERRLSRFELDRG